MRTRSNSSTAIGDVLPSAYEGVVEGTNYTTGQARYAKSPKAAWRQVINAGKGHYGTEPDNEVPKLKKRK
jgi:hypothetical protein